MYVYICRASCGKADGSVLPPPPPPYAGVPKTKPLSELQAPVTKVTTLENGLRVATQETYGPVS